MGIEKLRRISTARGALRAKKRWRTKVSNGLGDVTSEGMKLCVSLSPERAEVGK